MVYKDNGELKRVKDTSSDRKLTEEHEIADETMEEHSAASKRQLVQRSERGTAGETMEQHPPASRRRLVETNDGNHVDKTLEQHLPFSRRRTTEIMEQHNTAPSDARRRLYDCEDCEETWETVCSRGMRTVCALEGYGHPLASAAQESIGVFCEDFGDACAEHSSGYVCLGECEQEIRCLAPFTITLEWTGGPDEQDNDLAYALDLYVIEPGGTTVFWNNPDSVRAR